MRTRIKNVRVALPALLAVGAIGAGVAGCGGGYSSAGSGASSPPASSRAQRYAPASRPAAARAGIPQHNGGDQDTDNNGGPSDGDGNL